MVNKGYNNRYDQYSMKGVRAHTSLIKKRQKNHAYINPVMCNKVQAMSRDTMSLLSGYDLTDHDNQTGRMTTARLPISA